MRLENLIRDINDEMYKKIMDNRTVEEADARRQRRKSVLLPLSMEIFQPGF